MMDNKEGIRTHSRKYIGVILKVNNLHYFAPLSSPKLLGTIKLNNMIPVPNSEIVVYDVNNEKDLKYKNLIIDELVWIQRNNSTILQAANRLYGIKINEKSNVNDKNKRFFESIIDFKEAELKCKEFCEMHSIQDEVLKNLEVHDKILEVKIQADDGETIPEEASFSKFRNALFKD